MTNTPPNALDAAHEIQNIVLKSFVDIVKNGYSEIEVDEKIATIIRRVSEDMKNE